MFYRWSSKNVKNQKNGFVAKIAWHDLCQEGKKRAFSCTLSVLAKTCSGPKTVQTRKDNKSSGFNGKCPKPKMTPFFQKRFFFDMGEKVSLTNCVFEKLCFSANTILIVFSEKHSNCNIKLYVLEKEKLWNTVGCFENGQKVFLVCFFCFCFRALMLLWFVSCVSGKVARVSKCLFFFPCFGGFCGMAYSLLFGFGRFRCFCGSFVCVCFLLFRFCFCLFWLCFCFVVGLLLVLFLFLLFFVFFCFSFLVFVFLCFLEGLRVRWGRWGGPKGHLTWPYTLLTFFCCFCVFVLVSLFLFLFGGFKGQVRWPKGPPDLALNPPYLLFFLLLFGAFLSLLLTEKPCFSPLEGPFVLVFFCVSLCFSLAYFFASPFFTFSFFVSLLWFSFFLASCVSFLFLVLAFSFLVLFVFVSRCYFVFVFLLVVLFCVESQS